MSPRARATLIGVAAIAFWAALALLTVRASGIPPFELLALNTAVAFLGGLGVLAIRGKGALALLRQPLQPWLCAFLAIFFYHALYFYALATVPPARASLIAYFWPLLIVILAALLPGGSRLQPRHLLGAGLGLVGVFLIFADRASGQAASGAISGYLAAVACALIWSSYSVINRRFASVPSEMLIGVCGAVSLAAGVAHWAFETTVIPSASQWVAIVLLGIGPVGLAFLAWDHATKHGNLPLLGTLGYLSPLVSTLLLVIAGKAPATIFVGLAALLIVVGAMVASMPRKQVAAAAE